MGGQWVFFFFFKQKTAYEMNHELFPEMYQSDWGMWLRRQYMQYLTNATRIIAISEKTKKDIVRFYALDPSIIDDLHLAIDPKSYWPERDPVRPNHLRASAAPDGP